MIWISVLFGLLSLLLQWFLNKKASGEPMTDRERRNANHALALMAQCRSAASECGLSPEGEQEPTMMASGLLPDGSLIVGWAIEHYGPALARQIVPDLPLTDEQWIAWLTKKWEDSRK